MEKKYGISLKWLAVTSYELRFDGITVVSDPYITECVGTDITYEAVEHCDVICLTHAHWDHVTDIPRLCKKFSPRILCGDHTAPYIASWLNYDHSLIYPMYPDNELDFGGVKIRALYGRHKSLGAGYNDICARLKRVPLCQNDEGLAAMQAVGTMESCNYLFTAPNGTKILLWGGTPTVEQIYLCRALSPDVAILQRGATAEAIERIADFAKEIGVKVFLPHHHDFKCVDDPSLMEAHREAFLRRVPNGRFISPRHGEWIDL